MPRLADHCLMLAGFSLILELISISLVTETLTDDDMHRIGHFVICMQEICILKESVQNEITKAKMTLQHGKIFDNEQ